MARSLRNLSWKGQKEEVGNFDLLRFDPPPITSSSSRIAWDAVLWSIWDASLSQIQSSALIRFCKLHFCLVFSVFPAAIAADRFNRVKTRRSKLSDLILLTIAWKIFSTTPVCQCQQSKVTLSEFYKDTIIWERKLISTYRIYLFI